MAGRKQMQYEQVSKSEFREKALRILRQVETTGEPVVVTHKGQPVIEVRPYQPRHAPPLERLRGSVIELIDPCGAVVEDQGQPTRR